MGNKTVDNVNEIQRLLEELSLAIGKISSAQATWKEIVLNENHKNQVIAINKFNPFFYQITESLHEQVVMGIFRLIDSRKDVNSLYTIVGQIDASNSTKNTALLNAIKQKLKDGNYWKSIRILRGNVYGHRNKSKNKSIGDFYRQAKVSSNHIDERVDYLRSQIDAIYSIFFSTGVNYRYKEVASSTKELMHHLVKTLPKE